ncbi:MAG: SDR family NAD(P)-dependent oxidoreductase [Myxococcota bacterium]
MTTGTGRLAGKAVLVTGAARGIGRAMARRFAAEGAHVGVADRRDDDAREVAAAIREAGGRAGALALDVASEASWEAAVDAFVGEAGGVDALVNNAGVLRVKALVETTLDELRLLLDTNLVGAFLGTRAVVPAMQARGGGSIVNFSSVQGLEGREGMAAYAASKFGVRGLSKTAALELGPLGIRVNTLFPGPTRTKMTERRGWTDDDYRRAYAGVPLGRMADADEIASLALFLVSDEASYCTGGEFVADGGVTAGKPRG